MKKFITVLFLVMVWLVVGTSCANLNLLSSNPCFDAKGKRISSFGHCNPFGGGTKLVPMYENEGGDESNASEAPESADEPGSDNDSPCSDAR